jgi:hypothetical protein
MEPPKLYFKDEALVPLFLLAEPALFMNFQI